MYLFFCFLVSVFIRCKYKFIVTGKEHVPKDSRKGGFIAACNHQFYWDCPIIAAVIPAKFSFIAKSELFEKKGLFRWIITKCGAFPVVRGAGDTAAIDRSIYDINHGRVFVIFPEGTRSKDGSIARAKSGVALIAGKADAPVLPICIVYGKKRFRQRVNVAIGEMIPAKDVRIDENDRRQLRKTAARIMDAIKALQADIYRANGEILPGSAKAESPEE
jgi:1-acyl-sn-glycerol-3-phosphate acyltransferase